MTTDIILTDIDGVCLNWEKAFAQWMHEKGYTPVEGGESEYNIGKRYGIGYMEGKNLVTRFNESAAIRHLEPIRDAVYWIKMFTERHQKKFIAVTSLSTDRHAIKAREDNLKQLFGDAFLHVISLDVGADKDVILEQLDEQYGGAWWIEDKPKNADVGAEIGYRSILMMHHYNEGYEGPALRARNWEDIYQLIMFDVKREIVVDKKELSM